MATPAAAFAQIATDCEAEGLTPKNGEKIGAEIAKAFSVQPDEVGIMRVDKANLVFVYPSKLHNVGSIPLNTTGSVAARCAQSKRAEILNNGDAIVAAMVGAIQQARATVNLESYIFKDDKAGKIFETALVDAARRGVEVRVLVDGTGSSLSGFLLARMRKAVNWLTRSIAHADSFPTCRLRCSSCRRARRPATTPGATSTG